MSVYTINVPENLDVRTVKAVLKALGVKVIKDKKKDSPYNPEFVAKIKQGEKDLREGKGVRVTLDEIWK